MAAHARAAGERPSTVDPTAVFTITAFTVDLGEALLLVLHHCTAKRGLAPLWIRHKRPDPPLAEVQVAEEQRLLQLAQATQFSA